MNSKQARILATNPAAYVRFMGGGKLPQGVRPQSPLITLLESISPRERLRIQAVTVGPSLGYIGQATFANAEQALRWLKPEPEMYRDWPAESRRIKAFCLKLSEADLVAAGAVVPA